MHVRDRCLLLKLPVKVIWEGGICIEIADTSRADVHHHSVVHIELRLPTSDQCKTSLPIVQTSICFSEEFRWSWVKVDGVDAPVAIEEADVAVLQCKGRDISPIGAAEGNHIFKRFVSRLVYKASTEREGLPAVGVVQRKSQGPSSVTSSGSLAGT